MQKYAPQKVIILSSLAAGNTTDEAGVPDETKRYLQDLAEKDAGTIKQMAEDSKKELENLPESEKKDPEAWRKKIKATTQTKIDDFTRMMHKSEEKAIEKIEQLLPERQESAADAWTSILAWLMKGVQALVNALDWMFGKVVELWNTIVEAVTTAFNKVKEVVEGVVDDIGNFFSSL